jgi:hypothetical protein
MVQNPYGEANSRSVARQVHYILCNIKVHCRVHKSSPHHILSQTNPIHIISLSFLRIDSLSCSLTYTYVSQVVLLRKVFGRNNACIPQVWKAEELRLIHLVLFTFTEHGMDFVSPLRAICRVRGVLYRFAEVQLVQALFPCSC